MNEPSSRPAPASTATGLPVLPSADKLTISWLLQHVPMSFWLALAGAFAAVFSAGVASANLAVVQSLFAARSPVALTDFINKAVSEKGTYTVGSGPQAIEMHVVDVSVARKVVTVEIGLAGRAKERVDVAPNQERSVAIGASVFTLVVHDVADATLGPDIAVLSFQARR